jgi:hypothetical protein
MGGIWGTFDNHIGWRSTITAELSTYRATTHRIAISKALWISTNTQIIDRYREKRGVGAARLQLTVFAVAHIQFSIVVIDG